MAIGIGDAVLKVGVDKRDFDRDMKGLRGAINKHKKAIGLAMVGMGVAAVGAAVASIKAFADMGDAVHKMALRTEFSTEALSEWKHVAEISGTSLTSLEKGVKKMSKTIVDASDGMATYVRSFDRIGLSAEQLMELAPEEQFETIMMAIAGLESPTLQAATAQDIFGRAGTELLPVMKAGKEGIEKLRKEARTLGIVFDQEAAESAANFKDSLTRLDGAVNGMKFTLARELMPAMEAAIPLLEQWAIALGPIIENTLNWWAAEDKQIKLNEAFQYMQRQRLLFGNNLNNQYEQSIKLLESILKNQGLWTDEQAAVIARLKEEIRVRKEHTEVIEEGTEALEEQVEAYQEVTEQIEKAIEEMEYERSKAGELRIGVDDVIKALHLMGKSNEYIAETLIELGDEGDNVLAVLDAFAISAERVAGILETGTINVLEAAEAYMAYQKALAEARGELDKTKEVLEEPGVISGEEDVSAEAQWGAVSGRRVQVPEEAWAALYPGVPWGLTWGALHSRGFSIEEIMTMFPRAMKWWFDKYPEKAPITPFPHGGIAMNPIVASIASRSPEAVIPLDRLEGMIGGRRVNIYVELDGRIIAQAVGQPLVDEIRLKTGIKM